MKSDNETSRSTTKIITWASNFEREDLGEVTDLRNSHSVLSSKCVLGAIQTWFLILKEPPQVHLTPTLHLRQLKPLGSSCPTSHSKWRGASMKLQAHSRLTKQHFWAQGGHPGMPGLYKAQGEESVKDSGAMFPSPSYTLQSPPACPCLFYVYFKRS